MLSAWSLSDKSISSLTIYPLKYFSFDQSSGISYDHIEDKKYNITNTIIDVSDTTYTIELTGVAEKIIAFMNSLGKIKIVEMVRSGALGISRGAQGLQTKE